ncbi:MAG: hypothetical protein E1N59_2004 [Puniceicoccaceae bacterium 5H]|nr:MAG: hypothetical protein E1N59_2004 [Puniceicoccaceae bacterium 5H]
MKTLYTLTSLALLASPLAAQSEIFQDPGYEGTTQYSEWDLFSYAYGTGNAPDVAGTVGLITQRADGAMIASSGNIYGFGNNLDVSLTADSPEPLGQISLQYRLLGQEGAVLDTSLWINGGETELEPTTSAEIYREEFGTSYGDTVDVAVAYTWDLSGYSVTSYEIVFDTLVHSSLDQVRLDTTTEFLGVDLIAPELVGTTIENGMPTVRFTTTAGQSYQLMASSDRTTWTAVGAGVEGDGSVHAVSDPTGLTGDARFYLVVAQ